MRCQVSLWERRNREWHQYIFFLGWANNEEERPQWGRNLPMLFPLSDSGEIICEFPPWGTSQFERSKQSDWRSGNYERVTTAFGLREKIPGERRGEWRLAQRKTGLRIKVIWNLIVITSTNLGIWMNRIAFNEMYLRTQTVQVKISVATKSISFISFVFIDKEKIFSLGFSNAVAEHFLRKISVMDRMHLKF